MSKFVWFEYVSKQEQQAQGFFGEVFHWTTQAVPMPQGNYTMIAVGDRTIGGYYASDDAPAGTRWLVYMQVASAAETVAKIASLGGKVLKPPYQIADFGTMAIATDPFGAMFAVWQPSSNEPTPEPVDGSFCWTELFVADRAAAAKFYAAIGGFVAEDMVAPGFEEGYTVLNRDGEPRAGVTVPLAPGQPASWLAYVQVADADATIERARKLGAKILVPPTDVPNIGRYAVFADPQGASLGLLQPPAR